MTNSVEPASTTSVQQRHGVTWLLVLGLLTTLPLVVVFCSDLWFRSDLRFFPLLITVPTGLAVWRIWRPDAESSDHDANRPKQANRSERARRSISLGLLAAGGVSAVSAPLLFSPWLAILGLTLTWIAWLFDRFDRTPWPRLLKWTLPLVVLLLLPLGEQSNLVPNFSSKVTYPSSSLLDLLGVDHLPSQQTLQIAAGEYDVAAACRGMGNPYLMFSLVVLMCMGTRCSLSVGLLTTATAPLWSWGGTVLVVVSSVWLADKRDIFIWPDQREFFVWSGERLCVAQTMALIGGLVSALLSKWGLQLLLAPFESHAAGVGKVHKFFNRVVLWPQPDPLRKRRAAERSQLSTADSTPDNQPWWVRRSGYILGVVACLFITCGTISALRLMGTSPAGWPSTRELMTHAKFSLLARTSPLSQATLPDELMGMHLIGFEQVLTPGTTTGKPITNRWTYVNEKQAVIIQSDAVYRGPVAIERQRLLDGNRLVERQPAVERQVRIARQAAVEENIDAVDPAAESDAVESDITEPENTGTYRIESLTLDDPIVGRSYLAYINLPVDGSSSESMRTYGESFLSRLRSAVAYQPSSACISLWLEGSLSQTKDEREQLQQMLVQAVDLIRRAE